MQFPTAFPLDGGLPVASKHRGLSNGQANGAGTGINRSPQRQIYHVFLIATKRPVGMARKLAGGRERWAFRGMQCYSFKWGAAAGWWFFSWCIAGFNDSIIPVEDRMVQGFDFSLRGARSAIIDERKMKSQVPTMVIWRGGIYGKEHIGKPVLQQGACIAQKPAGEWNKIDKHRTTDWTPVTTVRHSIRD